MAYCEDCGSRVYGGVCVNCNEDVFIAEQEAITNLPEAYAFEPISDSRWKTIARWIDGDISEDIHDNRDAAVGVRDILLRDGNDRGKPLSVEIEEVRDN